LEPRIAAVLATVSWVKVDPLFVSLPDLHRDPGKGGARPVLYDSLKDQHFSLGGDRGLKVFLGKKGQTGEEKESNSLEFF
jgi:hypothetical protein